MIPLKEKEEEYMALLSTILVLEYILLDAHFCLSYKNVNYCKI